MNLVLIIFICQLLWLTFVYTAKRDFLCGEQSYYKQDNSEIVSHAGFRAGRRYGKNQHCTWTIAAPEGMHVELVPLVFELQNVSDYSGNCDLDYLEVFDGKDTIRPSLGRFCGTSFRPITSTQRFLTLLFSTNDGKQYRGFKLFYNFTSDVIYECGKYEWMCANQRCIDDRYRCDSEDDCGDNSDESTCHLTCLTGEYQCPSQGNCVSPWWMCNGNNDCDDGSDELLDVCNSPNCGMTNQTGTSGSLESPNFPSNYTDNTLCIYYIQAPINTKLLSFTFDNNFHLEASMTCNSDFVSIKGDNTSVVRGPYCGDISPGQIYIPGSFAYVRFQTNRRHVFSGFNLTWSVVN